MKANLEHIATIGLLTIAVSALLTACADDGPDSPSTDTGTEILLAPSFATATDNAAYSRGASNLTGSFKCLAYLGDGNGTNIVNDNVTSANGTCSWQNGPHIWPAAASSGNFLNFYACNSYGNLTYSNGFWGIDYTQNGLQDDLLAATRYDCTTTTNAVPLQFIHALSGVKIQVINNTGHLNIIFNGLTVTNVPQKGWYNLPLVNSQFIDNGWSTIPTNNPRYNATNAYYTGTWSSHNTLRNIQPQTNPNISTLDNHKEIANSMSGMVIDNSQMFYLLPHYSFSAAQELIFDVQIWSTTLSTWEPNAFRQGDNTIRCRLCATDGWQMMPGRIYTITVTLNNPGDYSDPISVGCLSDEDWGSNSGWTLGSWIN